MNAQRRLEDELQETDEVILQRQELRSRLLHDLANGYRDKDQFEEADKLYKKALATREELGVKDGRAMRALRDYATSLILQGRLSEAFESEKQALAIAKSYAEIHSFEVNRSYSRLAAIAFADSDYVRAERYYRLCLAARERTLDANDPHLRPLLVDVGSICYHRKKFSEAEQYFRRALALPGEEADAEQIALRNNIGLSMCAQGKQSGARKLCQRSAELRMSLDSTDDSTFNDLSDVYCERDQFAEARPLCETALAAREHHGSDLVGQLKTFVRCISRLSCCESTDVFEARIKRLTSNDVAAS